MQVLTLFVLLADCLKIRCNEVKAGYHGIRLAAGLVWDLDKLLGFALHSDLLSDQSKRPQTILGKLCNELKKPHRDQKTFEAELIQMTYPSIENRDIFLFVCLILTSDSPQL